MKKLPGVFGAHKLILLVPVLLFNCSTPSCRSDSAEHKVVTSQRSYRRISCCAADSLFALCREEDIEISRQRCKELLPHSSSGNSMLQFKKALQSVGLAVEAQRLSVDEFSDVQQAAIVLIFPPRNTRHSVAQTSMGHYLVFRPLDNAEVRIINYPHKPIVLSTDYWIKHLKRTGIKEVAVLLCSRQY